MKVVNVLDASCKDCHRCLRHCPVGAIGFGQEQAWIIEEKCIYCGRCVNACPQQAKVPVDGTATLKRYLDSGETLIASVAPSFVAAMEMDDYRQFVGGLRQLGFHHVTETIHGAQYVAEEYLKLVQNREQPLISACCPTIVNLIEKHYPEMIPYLAPVISPMMLHGQILKKVYGEGSKVVFFGPCIAKIDELNRPEADKGVDLVLTFRQLNRLFAKRGIELAQCQQADFDLQQEDWPRDYPLSGGTISATINQETIAPDQTVAISGIEECISTLDDIRHGRIQPGFIEMLACTGGCVNGPEVDVLLGLATRKQKVLQYCQQGKRREDDHRATNGEVLQQVEEQLYQMDIHRQYTDRQVNYCQPSEREIQEILNRIGKFCEDDETNCGGCGYKSCREKAIAVYQGLAEEKMCIPYIKGRVESLSHVIVESSHNAIIVVNQEMIIQEFNPVANQLFNRRDEQPIGQPLYRYISPELFIRAWEEKRHLVHQRVSYEQYQLVTDQTLFPVEEYGVIVGIITNVTSEEDQKVRVRNMKKLAVEKAADVVHKQMKIVQEITGLLGETTVETKAALYELTQIIEEGE